MKLNLGASQHGTVLQDAIATGVFEVTEWGLFREGEGMYVFKWKRHMYGETRALYWA